MAIFRNLIINLLISELRAQLTQLEKAVSHIPQLVVSDLVKEKISASKSDRTSFEAHFNQILAALKEKQVHFYAKVYAGLLPCL